MAQHDYDSRRFGRLISIAAISLVAGGLIAAAALPAWAAGQTRYVATTGSDTANDCTDSGDPCATVQSAVNQADPGDTISVAAGTYPESVRVRISLTITGAGAGQTIISGDGSAQSVFIDGTDAASTPSVDLSGLGISGDSSNGGILVEDAGATLTDVDVSGNAGSGLEAAGGDAVVDVERSTVADNTGTGGVLIEDGGRLTVSQSTLFHNAAAAVTAADGAQASVANTTISETVPPAQSAGELGALLVDPDSTLAISGTIDAENQLADCAGTVTDDGYNLDSDGSCGLSAAAGSQSAGNADLGPLASNGGATKTLLPGLASDARNAIPAGSAGCTAGATDQRGVSRPQPAGGRCDVGSVEADVTDPELTATVSGTHRSHGWYRGIVTVRYQCAAGSAPLEGPCPAPTRFHSSGANHHVTRSIAATDGGTATVTVDGIQLDNTKPKVRVTREKVGHPYSSARKLHAKCHDRLSGIAACPVRVHREGVTFTYRATARDLAGNVAHAEGTYVFRH